MTYDLRIPLPRRKTPTDVLAGVIHDAQDRIRSVGPLAPRVLPMRLRMTWPTWDDIRRAAPSLTVENCGRPAFLGVPVDLHTDGDPPDGWASLLIAPPTPKTITVPEDAAVWPDEGYGSLTGSVSMIVGNKVVALNTYRENRADRWKVDLPPEVHDPTYVAAVEALTGRRVYL